MPSLRGGGKNNNAKNKTKNKNKNKKKPVEDEKEEISVSVSVPVEESVSSSSSSTTTTTEEESLAKDEVTTQQNRKWPIQDPAAVHKHESNEQKNGDVGDPDADADVNTETKDEGEEQQELKETDVIYSQEPKEDSEGTNNNHSSTQPVIDATTQEQNEYFSCPPLFIPSDVTIEYKNTLPSFPQRLVCNTNQSISTHPAFYLTAFMTILFITYCACCRKRDKKYFFRTSGRGGHSDSKVRGEYSALDTVYDELLDDFENEDLSSYLQDDDDDDSIASILSNWSEGGDGGFNGPGKIELSTFDDGNLSLTEMNG
jgi:hypothetical protein